jgi:hypothetical protein
MRAWVAGILLLSAAQARADDTPPADSIAGAKKDLAAVKSLSNPTLAAPSLPTLDMKDIGPAPGARFEAPSLIPVPDTTFDPTKKQDKAGTGNWLVDAMDKSDRSQQRGRDGSRRADTGAAKGTDRMGAPDDREAPGASDERGSEADRADEKEPAQRVVNPLDAFMSGWVSARDHDLLVPKAGADGGLGSDAPAAGAETIPGLDAETPGADGFLQGPSAGGWQESRPEANPFVAAFAPQAPAALHFFSGPEESVFEPAGLGALPAPSAGARGAEPERSFIPDFALPTDDDKYFKQLKKF